MKKALSFLIALLLAILAGTVPVLAEKNAELAAVFERGGTLRLVPAELPGVAETGAKPVGISPDGKVHPGEFEPMCNPIAQAMLLNEQHTQFNIALGLCVGHDSMFYKYSEALVTTLVAKDRVTGHNPAAAIYCAEGYFKNRL